MHDPDSCITELTLLEEQAGIIMLKNSYNITNECSPDRY